MKKAYFITGTDTGVGKTWATLTLMHYFKQHGQTVIGMKPIASGCHWQQGELKNEDALLLQKNASLPLHYQQINPYAFEAAVSPHLAAMNNTVQLKVILHAFNHLKNQADVILVEGAGGWLAPINDQHDMADLAKILAIPVIIIIAIRLGCINHARLTFQSIETSGVKCAGWLALCIDPTMKKRDENIETIANKITVPLLGILPYVENRDFERLAENILLPT